MSLVAVAVVGAGREEGTASTSSVTVAFGVMRGVVAEDEAVLILDTEALLGRNGGLRGALN